MFVLGLLLSLSIGLSLGLLGGGGSILTVPVIHYVFGAEAHAAIAMSLVVVGATSLVALIPHARAGRVRWQTGIVFGVSSMAGAYAGGRLGSHIPGAILIPAFAVIMLAAGVIMLVRARRSEAMRPTRHPDATRVLAIGVGVGALTGTLGAGGGFVIVPALTLAAGLPIAEAVGTSLFVIALNTMAGFAGAASHASLDGTIIVTVTAAAVLGSFVGARLVRRISARRLQQSFGWFVIVVGLFMLAREMF